jgi:hypothetical protein
MATQISDIFDPEVFDTIVDEKMVESNNLIASGILAEDPGITEMASNGGTVGTLTHFAPISKADPNVSSDDPAVLATPGGVANKDMLYRIAALNNAWSTMDLARMIAAKDPLDAIAGAVADYWTVQRNKRLIASAVGILTDNAANDSGDMVKDISIDTVDALTDDNLISAEAVIMAQGTMGDQQDRFVGIGVHSVLYTKMKLQNLIEFIPSSDGKGRIPTYLGMQLVVDDALPATAGTNKIIYTSVLFTAGAFALGRGRVINPSEVSRQPLAGNGAGADVLHSRVSDILHPAGFSFVSGSVAGAGAATVAELKLAANWDRVWDRKNVGLAFIKTNG